MDNKTNTKINFKYCKFCNKDIMLDDDSHWYKHPAKNKKGFVLECRVKRKQEYSSEKRKYSKNVKTTQEKIKIK